MSRDQFLAGLICGVTVSKLIEVYCLAQLAPLSKYALWIHVELQTTSCHL